MSLWWARKEQLDGDQVDLIENLPLHERHLILGPPGSGKTNVLLRRAQFVRSQNMPNVLVLTFTRPLTEFIKTGCMDAQDREIFPKSCVSTLESWIRGLYQQHRVPLPEPAASLTDWKAALASGAMAFVSEQRIPRYDTLFVDEAQDLMEVEVQLLSGWSDVLFFVGDDRQRIYGPSEGLEEIRKFVPPPRERTLQFHYRIAPEICHMADRILVPQSGTALSATSHYDGPRPGVVNVNGPSPREATLEQCIEKLRDQIRVYGDFIRQGDRLGVIVARSNDRDLVFNRLEEDTELAGKSKIIRARTGQPDDQNYRPDFDPDTPIYILTVQGCKGLEFRAAHWLFCEDLRQHHTAEHYYTVVTRAKTSLDVYFTHNLPEILARAHSQPQSQLWGK